MQPSYRKSTSGVPAAIFANPTPLADGDDWKDLRKGGPNGLVSVLTMLSWWGKGLSRQTQWQDDSSADWKATVVDVSGCLRSISASVSVTTKKRKVETGKKEGAKRYMSPESPSIFSSYNLSLSVRRG